MPRSCAVATSAVCALALLATACSDTAPTAPMLEGGGPQFAKAPRPLKVTPARLSFTEIGAHGTLTVTTSASGAITAAVSEPPCATVSPRRILRSPAKFTVTATAPGSCVVTLTDGGGASVQVPVRVVPLLRGTLALGVDHACGLTSAGAAYCWGRNQWGQLGNGASGTDPNPAPVMVQGALAFSRLTAGTFHTCGLTPAGVAYCWGVNVDGQLGSPTNAGVVTPNAVPLPVNTGLTFIALEAGAWHTCGLTATGAVYCWGSNQFGQLGHSENAGQVGPNPAPLQVATTVAFTQLAAGEHHNCGLTAAGAAHCWGRNNAGQLGTETNISTNTPTPPEAVSGNQVFASLAPGSTHTCGLTAAGVAYCWGSNERGQGGTSVNYQTAVPNTTPTLVETNLLFTGLAAGLLHTCGFVAGGEGYCWGTNRGGELTRSVTEVAQSEIPLLVAGALNFIQLAADGENTCGVTADGAAHCWGFNVYGQLGSTNGLGTVVGFPQAVSGGLTFAVP